jgi:hypothetical protein
MKKKIEVDTKIRKQHLIFMDQQNDHIIKVVILLKVFCSVNRIPILILMTELGKKS